MKVKVLKSEIYKRTNWGQCDLGTGCDNYVYLEAEPVEPTPTEKCHVVNCSICLSKAPKNWVSNEDLDKAISQLPKEQCYCNSSDKCWNCGTKEIEEVQDKDFQKEWIVVGTLNQLIRVVNTLSKKL